jgi:ATP-dependent helicase/nuclease subunit B
MKTVLGPFHPHLENALVEEIRRYKADNPLLPLLILVPSDSLRRRLKILLTRERNLFLINLEVLTFHQLSLRLFSETNDAQALALDEDLFLEEALRQIIRTGQPGTHFPLRKGFGGGPSAYRGLADASVDPAIALEALREGHSRSDQPAHRIFQRLQTVLNPLARENIQTSDPDKAATGVPESQPLNSSKFRFFYGNYDLTQIQLDFFMQFRGTIRPRFPLPPTATLTTAGILAERFINAYLQAAVRPTRKLLTNPVEKITPSTFRTLIKTCKDGINLCQ